MKQAILLMLLVIIQLSLKAQPEIGVSLAPGTTWLINNNVSDQGANLNYRTSFGFAGGLHAGYFFTKNLGLAVELNLASFNQRYQGDVTAVHFNAGDHLKYITIPVLFELKTPGGFYFEIGPQFNLFSSAKGDFTLDEDPFSLNYKDRNIDTGFSKTVVGGVFGLGGRFELNDNMALTAGLRFFGGFSDATKEMSQSEYLTEFSNQKLGFAVSFAHTDQNGGFRYEKTMAVSGSLLIGFVYAFGKK